MLFLVDAYRHKVCLVKQNIRRHQSRVGEKPGIYIIRMFGGFVFELCHALQFAKLGVAVQHPCQLCVSGNVALDEENTLFRVNAAGQQKRIGFQRVAAKNRGVLPHGNSVQVSKGIDAVVFILQADPVFESAKVVAERNGSAGLNGTEDYFFAF